MPAVPGKPPNPEASPGRPDSVAVPALTVFLFLLTVLLFAPVTAWLVRQTLDHEQLTHALVILALATAALVMEERPRLAHYGRFDRTASGALLASFGLLAAATAFKSVWWVLPAFALALAAWGLFLFGPGVKRAVGSIAAAFIGYILLAASVTALDWPLRAMAGRYAQWVLDQLGFFTGLGLAEGESPKLILLVDGYPFEVAAECNGFGLLGASLLLALLLAVYRPMPWVDRLLGLAVAIMLATLCNLLRIVTICILAPSFPDHYWAMHEVVGNAYFWACLALVWWMAWQGKAEKWKARAA
jgi:exosortase/archaeosortase family protein